MTALAVRERRDLEADPAAVWSLVADPERIGEWAPVKFVGWMGTNLPAVGQAFFVSVWGRPPIRLEIDEWEAGRRFRCGVDRPDGVLQVLVDTTVMSDGVRSGLELRFGGDVSPVRGVAYGVVLRHLFRRALNGASRSLRGG